MSAIENIALVLQTVQNLRGLKVDIVRNATAHLQMLADTVPTATVRTFIVDCLQDYAKRLRWQEDIRDDVGRKAALLDGLARLNCPENDVLTIVLDLRSALIAWSDLPRATRQNLVDLATAMQSGVERPDSVWPE